MWPGKIPFANLPPHLAWKSGDGLREAYGAIIAEWGSKEMVIVHAEDLPLEVLEEHLAAVLDVCGY